MVSIANEMSFEMVTGQLQRTHDSILCVKDGSTLLIYTNANEIPINLRREGRRRYENIDVTQCSYRSKEDGSLYCFFTVQLDRWLSGGRVGTFQMNKSMLEESSSVSIWPKASVSQKRLDPPPKNYLTGTILNITTDTGITLIQKEVLVVR